MNLEQAGIRYKIDIYNLEGEWESHTQMVGNAVQLAADCHKAYEDAEEYAEFVAAQTELSIRANPEESGLKNVTDKAVAAAVKVDPSCRAAIRKMIEAKHAMKEADGAVTTLEHKKRALTKLVDLWVKEYYSAPVHSGTQGNGETRMTMDERFELRRRSLSRQQQEEDAREDGDDAE